MVAPGSQNDPKTHHWDTLGPKSAPKLPQRVSHEASNVELGRPGETQGHPKASPGDPRGDQNEAKWPRGTKRGPRKKQKVKLQYYLVNNTIQEAKLHYYLLNNTIQKTVFYGFSWKLHYYLVNNTIQLTPKAANGPKNTKPAACKFPQTGFIGKMGTW